MPGQETQVQSLGQEDSPEEGNGNPLQYSCLEKSHGLRSLVGYSPWSSKESDTTWQLNNNKQMPERDERETRSKKALSP